MNAEDETAATHRFEATLPGYRGWQWAVVVAAPPGATHATVSESALLPGPDALTTPEFIPWEQRVRPGDLGPGDLLAPPANDPRLVPGYVATGDPVIDELAREVGLGRVQVLSREGRAEAAERWFTEFGPDTEMAKAAPAPCGLCGFYVPLAGALRESFGVCANAMGADGRVVNVNYGCGAHSDVVAPSGNGSPLFEAFDDHAVEIVELRDPVRDDFTAMSPGVLSPEGASGDVDGPSTVDADGAASVVAETPADVVPEAGQPDAATDAEAAPAAAAAVDANVAVDAAQAPRSGVSAADTGDADETVDVDGAASVVIDGAIESPADVVTEAGPSDATSSAADAEAAQRGAVDVDVAAETAEAAEDARGSSAAVADDRVANGAAETGDTEPAAGVADLADASTATASEADADASNSATEHGSPVAS
ncbi:hypothetical protein GCM10011591_33480 [Nocardia camponoti]|uniref:DUF3027 domain-containing protein n=1 Tax=Nocardia camponoti TaxID=1616106 RepID=A0A917QMZ9_9NOCA|nr:hypothetical protein GCM10011591_33480 [Nocardia camponoti]